MTLTYFSQDTYYPQGELWAGLFLYILHISA